MNVGIHGVGVHLPETVRRNDWWPASTVEAWRRKQGRSGERNASQPEQQLTPGMRAILAAMSEAKQDPFEGARERRVLAQGELSSAMEIPAARQALAAARVAPEQIGVLLTNGTTPDFLHQPNGSRIHQALGLPVGTLTIAVEGMCNSFLQQLTLAEALLRNGQAEYALLTQCCNMTCFMRPEDPFSAWFGDGASAVVVGRVADGLGLLGRAEMTDGETFGSIVTGIPGRRWYEGGSPIVGYLESPAKARLQFLQIADQSRALVEQALSAAALEKADVDVWACHQGAAWLPRATQEFIGLEHAKRTETFSWAGSLSSVNIPLGLAVAQREGWLNTGSVVAMFAGSAGMTATGTVLRWGTD